MLTQDATEEIIQNENDMFYVTGVIGIKGT